MIWKKSQMALGATAVIKPLSLEEEGVQGKYGTQNRYRALIDGVEYSTYVNQGDQYDVAFRAALQTGGTVTIQKYFDQTKQRAAYTLNKAATPHPAGVPATPAPTPTQEPNAPQRAAQAPQRPVTPQVDRRSVRIGLYACVKAVSHLEAPAADVGELFRRGVELWSRIEEFAETYQPPREDIRKIRALVNATGFEVPKGFEPWVCDLYGVSKLEDLSPEQAHQIINKWDKAAQAYQNAVSMTEEAVASKNEDVAPMPAPDPSLPTPGPSPFSPGPDGPDFPPDQDEEEEMPV